MIHKTLGHYVIEASIGAGGMGEVYRARDPRLGREVAIKVLRAAISSAPDARERFEREAQVISQLNHPNICTLHDIGREGDVDYLVMELLDGETLAARLERGPLPVHELIDVGERIADALGRAHAAGIVHRDLKPGNIMLTTSGVKLLDFGLARAHEAPVSTSASPDRSTVDLLRTAAGAVLGTPQYMAPEQIEGRAVDARSDVFAFGCVMHEMATAARPFPGDSITSILKAIVSASPETFSPLRSAVPGRLESIIRRCLCHDPEDRFSNAVEVGDTIKSLRSWVRREALPELTRIVENATALEEGPDCWSAFLLAREIEALAGDEPLLERLWPEFSSELSVVSDPPGATFSAKYYGEADGDWVPFGTTPLEGMRFPLGIARLKLEMSGRRTIHDVTWHLPASFTSASLGGSTRTYDLYEPGALPDEMEVVSAGTAPLLVPGLDHLEPEPTAAFLIDRDPVTNREFKAFVDAGGYADSSFWRHPIQTAEGDLSHEEAVTRFTDAVGRPGPASWEFGEYPPGGADLPVTGISWFEAAAYAAWCGKELPTLFHWIRVAGTGMSSQIVPVANLDGQGLLPVGSTSAIHRFGVRDIAGNVREWVWNECNQAGERFILGGGWNDPGYAFMDAYAQSSFDRSATNGFRCIRPIAPDPNQERLSRPIELPVRDFLAEEPVSDDVFTFFLRQFQYDDGPLEATVEEEQHDETARRILVSFQAGYGGERMLAYLFLPAVGAPPYQTVVLFPGSLALHQRTVSFEELRRTDFVIKSGRALILPVYKGTYQRGGGINTDYPKETNEYKDHVVAWAKDLSRSIDYLESRDDIDAERIAYLGVSWGGAMGCIMPAVETRIRANVLYVAGLNFQRSLPEADQLNYITRVKQPTLMLNGELDFYFPEVTSQRPMFELLGTPPEHKRRVTYPRGHSVPRVEFVRESLAWLDRYLGPVQ